MQTVDLGSNPTIAKAVVYLVESQTPSGWWQDFDTLAGPSNEWVTAYIAWVLARVQTAQARTAVAKAWNALMRRRHFRTG